MLAALGPDAQVAAAVLKARVVLLELTESLKLHSMAWLQDGLRATTTAAWGPVGLAC